MKNFLLSAVFFTSFAAMAQPRVGSPEYDYASYSRQLQAAYSVPTHTITYTYKPSYSSSGSSSSSASGSSSSYSGSSGYNQGIAEFVQMIEEQNRAWKKQDVTNNSAYYKVLKYAYQSKLRKGPETYKILWDMAEKEGMSINFYKKHFKEWSVKEWTPEEIEAERNRQAEEYKRRNDAYVKEWEDKWKKMDNGMAALQANSDEFDRQIARLQGKTNRQQKPSEAVKETALTGAMKDLLIVSQLEQCISINNPVQFEQTLKELSAEYVQRNYAFVSNLKGSMAFIQNKPSLAALYFMKPFATSVSNMQALSNAIEMKNYDRFTEFLEYAKTNFKDGSNFYRMLLDGVEVLKNPHASTDDRNGMAFRLLMTAQRWNQTGPDFGTHLLLDMAVALNPKNEPLREERYRTSTALGKSPSTFDTLLFGLKQ